MDFDADIETAQLFDENPADPPVRKDLGRDDDALDPIPVGPFGQRARFLVGVRNIGSEIDNCLGWDAELEEHGAITRQRMPSEAMKSTSLDAFASRGSREERRKGLGFATERSVGRRRATARIPLSVTISQTRLWQTIV